MKKKEIFWIFDVLKNVTLGVIIYIIFDSLNKISENGVIGWDTQILLSVLFPTFSLIIEYIMYSRDWNNYFRWESSSGTNLNSSLNKPETTKTRPIHTNKPRSNNLTDSIVFTFFHSNINFKIFPATKNPHNQLGKLIPKFCK